MNDAAFWERGKNCRPHPLRVPGEWAAVLYLGYSIIFSALKQLLFCKKHALKTHDHDLFCLLPTFRLCSRKFALSASDFRLLRRDQDFCNHQEKRFPLTRLRS